MLASSFVKSLFHIIRALFYSLIGFECWCQYINQPRSWLATVYHCIFFVLIDGPAVSLQLESVFLRLWELLKCVYILTLYRIRTK
jgi:hypothetical protein